MTKVLVFAPHNDDEVLGCGGTIALLSSKGYEVTVCEVTSGNNLERVELIKTEAKKAHKLLGVKKTIFMELPVVELKSVSQSELTCAFSNVISSEKPAVVFLPHKGDMHIDHRIVSEMAMVAVRPLHAPYVKAVYAYETLSETEWNIPSVENAFCPNYWIDITNTFELKLKAMNCYKTQICSFPHPRSSEAITALATFRGSTVGVEKAEAFVLLRGIWSR